MTQTQCNEVERNILSGELPDPSHIASCNSCGSFVSVQRAMETLAAPIESGRRMPPAEVILVRARLLEKRRLAARATRPLEIFQKVAYGVLGGGWLLFIATQWLPLVNWVSGLELSLEAGIAASSSLPLSFLWMLAALSLMTMMTMLHGTGGDEAWT